MVVRVPPEPEVQTMRVLPNLALARRIAAEVRRTDAVEVYRALERRCPGVLRLSVRLDELSRDQYDDLCCAVELELTRRPLKLEA
jgi:hypothetical protein